MYKCMWTVFLSLKQNSLLYWVAVKASGYAYLKYLKDGSGMSLTSIILAEIGRIMVEDSQSKYFPRPHVQNNGTKWPASVAQAVELTDCFSIHDI
jgi:hypothetical protein